MLMNLKPIADHIIIKPAEAETTTASGIIIPDTANKERSERGEVIAVGPGKFMENGERSVMDVTVGQTVLFKKYAPDEVEVNGATYFIIRQEDVIAIIE